MVRRRLLMGTGFSLLGVGLVGCASDPAPFDPRFLQQSERNSSRETKSEYLRPLPTTRIDSVPIRDSMGSTRPATRATTGPNLTDDPIVRMPLREIIHRAVANNHEVKVAGYQPAIEGTRVIEAQANFDPVFFTNIQYQHKRDMNGGVTFNTFVPPVTVITSFTDEQEIATFQTGVKQNLESGGQIQLQYQTQYSWFNPQRTQFNPFYESDLTFQLTQPLLRNFGYDVNQARIVINRDNQKVSLLEFRKAVEQNAADIEKAYWQLQQALRTVEIQQQLVGQTESLYQILYNRMTKGLDVSQLQVSQTATRLESRRADLLQAKSQARDFSDQLKGLMSDPEYPVTSSVLILPADLPVESPMHFNLEDEINTAMENRFELGEQQLKIDAATVTVSVAKNNLLPQLNFIGSIGAQGAESNLGDAVKKNSDFNHIDFSVGLQLEVPFGNRAARAIWKRTLLERMQAIEQYRALIEQVSVEVKTSARSVETAWDIIYNQRQSRFAAEDALKAINDRERANEPLRPEFVQLKLDTQQILAGAMQAEAQAIANYNIALSQLERTKGTLLRYNNVLLEEEQARMEEDALLR